MGNLHKVQGLWGMVLIELTNVCNFSCDFCPSDFLKRKRVFMPRELWKKILSELGEKKMTSKVTFSLLGEPLLHKDVFEAIRFANNQGLRVILYTNGSLLDKDKTNELLDSLENGAIVLGIQDIVPDNFNKRCRGLFAWESYISQLQNFAIRAQSLGKPIQIHFMADVLSAGWDLKKIIKEQQAMQVIYDQWAKALNTKNKGKINIFNPTAYYPLGENSSFYVKSKLRYPTKSIDEEREIRPSDHGFCIHLTDTFVVLADGTCTFCCNDYEGELNLGNVRENSLEDIFYGEKSAQICEAGKANRMIKDICKICCGRVVYKKSQKPAQYSNLILDFYLFIEHIKQYGIESAIRKAANNIRRRISG